ncbi:arginyltransferase [Pelagibius sp.]|uniref:arginyltransferase n=1 Tax=Pelagibius sp. TaxID=1931238 RepID=UPI0026019506|nr:arginyltransferase [Pelagibius sp.]
MRQDRPHSVTLATEEGVFGPLQDFFVLEPSPCPYLPDRMERKLLTEISGPQAQSVYTQLSHGGFRRSHRFAYRPACATCDACVPVRVVVGQFQPSKSLRRIARFNADLSVTTVPNRATGEQFALFNRYIQSRHGDGEMAGMIAEEYASMVESSDVDTRLAEFRDEEGQLVAVCLLDWLTDGPSAVYSFFDPAVARRSLGTFMVLWLIDAAAAAGAAHVYLGYWIEHSRKMAYKTRFQPLEGLLSGVWQPLIRRSADHALSLPTA